MLDQERAGTTGALVDEPTARPRRSPPPGPAGYLDGKALAEVFAWLRPGDLIWNYWVNNYLAGRTPPAFDILFWNADTTRMTAALHRDFVTTAMGNALTRPGASTLLGTEIDLGKVDVDSYVVAGIADHICPWRNCYASTQLLGGTSRFVLSTNGHIAAMVNPPDNAKSSFQMADQHPADAAGVARRPRTEPGLLVAGLRRLAGRALRPSGSSRAEVVGRQAVPRRSARRPAATCWTPDGRPLRTVTVGGRRLRVAVRPGDRPGPAAAAAVQRHRGQPGGCCSRSSTRSTRRSR